MATAKSTESSPQKDIERLTEQVATLRKDISGIVEALGDLGHSSRDAAVERASRKAAELRDSGQEHLHAAQHRAEDLGRQATDAVRHQPAAAVGLAVGLGFLLGFMTGRK